MFLPNHCIYIKLFRAVLLNVEKIYIFFNPLLYPLACPPPPPPPGPHALQYVIIKFGSSSSSSSCVVCLWHVQPDVRMIVRVMFIEGMSFISNNLLSFGQNTLFKELWKWRQNLTCYTLCYPSITLCPSDPNFVTSRFQRNKRDWMSAHSGLTSICRLFSFLKKCNLWFPFLVRALPFSVQSSEFILFPKYLHSSISYA